MIECSLQKVIKERRPKVINIVNESKKVKDEDDRMQFTEGYKRKTS